VPEAPQRTEHRLALGVRDLRLEDDVDDHPRHAVEPTWAARAADFPGEICTVALYSGLKGASVQISHRESQADL
jgi:hypothetical protein